MSGSCWTDDAIPYYMLPLTRRVELGTDDVQTPKRMGLYGVLSLISTPANLLSASNGEMALVAVTHTSNIYDESLLWTGTFTFPSFAGPSEGLASGQAAQSLWKSLMHPD
jgi:hypothetical protein